MDRAEALLQGVRQMRWVHPGVLTGDPKGSILCWR
jgi:hypothetical protein